MTSKEQKQIPPNLKNIPKEQQQKIFNILTRFVETAEKIIEERR